MKRFPLSSFFLACLMLTLVLTACGASDEPTPTMAAMGMADMPEELDTSTTRLTDAEIFQVSVTSNMEPPELNEIHSWTVHIETPDGQPVEQAEITVDGGMPQHNHGFPTTPEITEELGNGNYLLDGVKFSMAGWWELKLTITTGDQTDVVTFNIILP